MSNQIYLKDRSGTISSYTVDSGFRFCKTTDLSNTDPSNWITFYNSNSASSNLTIDDITIGLKAVYPSGIISGVGIKPEFKVGQKLSEIWVNQNFDYAAYFNGIGNIRAATSSSDPTMTESQIYLECNTSDSADYNCIYRTIDYTLRSTNDQVTIGDSTYYYKPEQMVWYVKGHRSSGAEFKMILGSSEAVKKGIGHVSLATYGSALTITYRNPDCINRSNTDTIQGIDMFRARQVNYGYTLVSSMDSNMDYLLLPGDEVSTLYFNHNDTITTGLANIISAVSLDTTLVISGQNYNAYNLHMLDHLWVIQLPAAIAQQITGNNDEVRVLYWDQFATVGLFAGMILSVEIDTNNTVVQTSWATHKLDLTESITINPDNWDPVLWLGRNYFVGQNSIQLGEFPYYCSGIGSNSTLVSPAFISALDYQIDSQMRCTRTPMLIVDTTDLSAQIGMTAVPMQQVGFDSQTDSYVYGVYNPALQMTGSLLLTRSSNAIGIPTLQATYFEAGGQELPLTDRPWTLSILGEN